MVTNINPENIIHTWVAEFRWVFLVIASCGGICRRLSWGQCLSWEKLVEFDCV